MDPHPFTLRDALAGINRRRILVVLIFSTILAAVGAATLLATKMYESQANLFVRLGRENIGLDPTTTLGDSSVVAAPMSREAEINSVVHMVRSRSLFEEVVDEIGVAPILSGVLPGDEAPHSSGSGLSIKDNVATFLTDVGVLNDISDRERAIIKLTKKLSVKALERSNVILIRYEAETPAMAQAVVAALTDRYLDRHVQWHRASGSQEFMAQQAKTSAAALKQREQELVNFKIESGMISSELQKQQLVLQLSTLQNRLIDAEIESVALETEVANMRERFQALGKTQVISETVGTGNDGVDGMRQDLYRMELELETLLGKHTAQHPSAVALRDAIAQAKKILAQDEAQRTETVMGSNPVFDQIQIELIKKEPQWAAAQARAESLRSQLKDVQKSLETFSQRERQFVELTRELEIHNENYRRYVRSLAQATVDDSLEKNKLSNISVSQPASISEKPVRPNKLINLLVGLALGCLGAFGTAVFLEYLNPPSQRSAQRESVPRPSRVPARPAGAQNQPSANV